MAWRVETQFTLNHQFELSILIVPFSWKGSERVECSGLSFVGVDWKERFGETGVVCCP